MFRKRRIPAPFFRIPGSPYNPATGKRAPLGRYPIKETLLSIFQVIGDDPNDTTTEDTHENYIVCRGFDPSVDPNFRFLHDPYTAAGTKAINVAKPFGARGTYTYKRGQIVVAARIQTRLGANQGKAKVTIGHPKDLDEVLEILLDDNDVAIAWLDIATDVPQSSVLYLNDCGATYPAWGVSRVTDRTPGESTVPANITVAKVDATYRWQYFVNGPHDIENGDYGYGSYLTDFDGEVLFDTASSPATGERWGPKDGSFLLWENRPGFHITGGVTGTGGQKRVGAKQVPPGEVRVKHDDGGASFAADAAGPRTFGIYGGVGLTTDTGLEVTIDKNCSSVAWASGKYGMASLDMGRIGGVPTQT